MPIFRSGASMAGGDGIRKPGANIFAPNIGGLPHGAGAFLGGANKVIPFPTGFWTGLTTPSWNVVLLSGTSLNSQSGAKYGTTVNFDAIKPAYSYTYYVSPTGSSVASPSNNDPSTPVTPVRATTLANARGGAVRFVVENSKQWGNNFNSATSWNSTVTAVVIEPWVGQGSETRPYLINHDQNAVPVWTSVGSNTYSTPWNTSGSSAGAMAFDLLYINNDPTSISYECPPQLTSVASLATCQATPGSLFYDSVGQILNIHAQDDRNLVGDTNMVPITRGTVLTASRTTPFTLWMDGIYWFGGVSAQTNATAGLRINFNARSCGFFGGFNTATINLLSITGGVDCIFLNCRQGGGFADGFNYHGDAQASPTFLEVGLRSIRSGYAASSQINNTSTCHENSRGVRVDGAYAGSQGPVIGDINTAKTFNVGVRGGVSVGASTGANTVQSGSTLGDTTEVYLYDDTLANSPNAALCVGVSGSAIYYKSMSIAGLTTSVAVGGILAAY